MRIARSAAALFFLVLLSLPCFAHRMAVVVSEHNQVANLTSAQLSKIFLTQQKKWPDGRDIVLILHRSSNGESATLQHLTRMSALQFQMWCSDHREQIKFVDSDHDLLTIIETTPGAVGLVDVREVKEGVKVLHIDGKLPLEDGYLPH